MATQRPTLPEIISRIEQDLVGRLATQPARIALTRILARAEAGVAHGLYGYIDTKEKNFLPDTGDEASVQRWANLKGVVRLSPVPASGTVQATGVNGGVIPAGRELKSSAGIIYTVDADVTVSAGVALIAVTAAEVGLVGNVATGATLTFTQPVPSVNSATVVQAPGLTGGSDIEAVEAFRVRVLDRLRAPPKGGAESDYVEWAKEAHPDVTRAFVSAGEMAPNSVTVRIVTDDAPGGLIPTTPVIDAVLEYIQARAPVTALPYVAAPVAVSLALSIKVSPNTQAVRDAITAELADMIKREAKPGGTILLTRIGEAISNAAGEADHLLLSPSANVVYSTGQIAVLGTITWSTL